MDLYIVRELVRASKTMRDASNVLWLAKNPAEAAPGDPPLTMDEAQERYVEAIERLKRAEYYAEKALQALDPH